MVGSTTSSRTDDRSSSFSSDDSCVLEDRLDEVTASIREAMQGVFEIDDGERAGREAKYVEALLALPGIEEVAEEHGFQGSVDVQEVTRLFVECDANFWGRIPQHGVVTIFRRMGRAVSSRKVFGLIEKLLVEKYGAMRRKDLDFLEVLEVVGNQVTHERALLKTAYEQLQGLKRPAKLHEVAKGLESVQLSPRSEQLRRIADELQVLHRNNSMDFAKADQFLQLADLCREYEKKRAFHRAGYSNEQVSSIRDAFETVVGAMEGEISKDGLCKVLEMLRVMPDDPEEYVMMADFDDNQHWSFDECVHLVRRFHDQSAYHQTVLEHAAAREAELSREELNSLKTFFLMLVAEVGHGEFTYFALTKALRLLTETSITVEQNASLQKVFREHATLSKVFKARKGYMLQEKKRLDSGEPREIEALQLLLPDFVRIVARLWQEDLLSIRSDPSRHSSISEQRTSSLPSEGRSHRRQTSGFDRDSIMLRLREIVLEHGQHGVYCSEVQDSPLKDQES